MKKLVIIVLCTLVSISVSAQIRKTVKADGPVRTKEIRVGDFTGISTSGGIDVYLTQGNGSKVSLETEENLHEYIKIEVKGDVLHIYSKVNIKNSKVKKVHVTMDEVNSLKASSAGDIFGETVIKSEDLKLSASSAGDIKLEVMVKSIDASCSSSGDIHLSGRANFLKSNSSSSGDLMASDLKVKEAKVSASSSGDVFVNVSDKLYARASSSGDVRYYGDPEVDAKSSSSGSVKKK